MNEPAINCRNLSLGYPGLVTLKEANLSFAKGQVTCIVGGSGCGKSTLLKCLIGLLPPLGGNVEILGQDLYGLEEEESGTLLKRVGVLFQNGAMLNSISVVENVVIPLRAHSQLPEDLILETGFMRLAQVGLAHAGWKLPSELSGGMRKRAALARAMVLDPEILFCDEPSAGLDPVTAADLDSLILSMKEIFGMTVIVVTHELGSIRTIADGIVMLKPGHVVFSGSQTEAMASQEADMKAFFQRKGEGMKLARSLLEQLVEER